LKKTLLNFTRYFPFLLIALTITDLRPKRIASEQLGTQMSKMRPLIAPPVSATVYVPLYEPAVIWMRVPSGKTRGSAATIPRLTPPPLAVLPCRQYAVALNARDSETTLFYISDLFTKFPRDAPG